MNTMLQFRVLYRQFLFRLMDVELLSTSAGGDASTLLGQFGALLIFGSLLFALGALTVGQAFSGAASGASGWPVECLLISSTFVVGVFALLSWDSAFLDRRDVLVLAPLPVSGRTLFSAKIAASASAMGLTVAAWNCLSGLAWPAMLAPASSGVAGTVRCACAFWVTVIAGAAFLYSAILALQGLVAQLPRGWYLRASSGVQICAFVLLLWVFFFQPSLASPVALAAPENRRALALLPTYWFLGLFNELGGSMTAEGHAVMAPLAYRAVAGLGVALLVAAAAYWLSYHRTLRKIVEEPDLLPGSHGAIRLPRFGGQPKTALAHFAIRTVLRSRPHRTVLAFYLGGGFGLAAVYLGGALDMMHLRWIDLLERVNFYLMAASILVLCAAWLGARTIFYRPLDLRANWVFRIVPTPEGKDCLSAARRALLWLAVYPVLIAWTALALYFWPWRLALQHTLVLALLGNILADASLRGFGKIPFTYPYVPGKSKVHMVFWFGVIPFLVMTHHAAEWELGLMGQPAAYLVLVLILAVAAVAMRLVANAAAARPEGEAPGETEASSELIGLGLNR
jgi:hypothetical protein